MLAAEDLARGILPQIPPVSVVAAQVNASSASAVAATITGIGLRLESPVSASMTDRSQVRRHAGHRAPSARCAALLFAFGLVASFAAWAQSSPEVQVTTSNIPDYEFDTGRSGVFCQTCNFGAGNARLTYTDATGKTWVGQVDFNTGAFYPPDGRGVLLDSNSALVTHFGNGPEWVAGSGGSQIVFTRYPPGPPPGPNTAELAIAHMVNGSWVTESVPGSRTRVAPLGTLDPADSAPRIHYSSSSNNSKLYWRSLDSIGVETTVPTSRTDGAARRWVPGTRKIIYQAQPPNSPDLLIDQIFMYDTDTGQREQLTFDAVGKVGAFAWRAPEYNNEIVFLTMALERGKLLVYRKSVGADNVARWIVVKTITGPPAAPYFWSPEAFVHNGRSYVFMQVSAFLSFADRSHPNQIAMSGIDPLRQDFRVLTSDQPPRLRLDPEYFITAKGPLIYYNRAVPETTTHPAVNDGVWYVDTKLGPPKR